MKMAIIICFFILSLILSGNSENLGNGSIVNAGTSNASETDQILQTLDLLEKQVKNFAKSAIRFGLPFFMRTAEKVNLSHSCIKSGIQFLRDFLQLKPWTLRMLDSLGKPSSGILNGMLWIRGDYDQCLKIENPVNRKNEIIHGKYCVIILETGSDKKEKLEAISAHDNNTLIRLLKDFIKPLWISDATVQNYIGKLGIRFDVCLTSTCTEEDLKSILKLLTGPKFLLNIRVDFCTTSEKKIKYTTAQIISIIFVGMFVFWVGIATTIDALQRFHIVSDIETNFFKNIISVSAFTSGKKLLNDTLWKKTSSLGGIKTLIIFSIVFVHSTFYICMMSTALENYRNIVEMFDYFPQEVSNSAFIMIETFFFISGFLTLYLQKTEDRLWFRQILVVLKRIIRLTIPILCTLTVAILFSVIADGPHSYLFIRFVYDAVENCWKYLSHTANFIGIKPEIIGQAWFINVLVQLTIFTTPFVFILHRWPKYGRLFFTLMILAGFISYTTIIYNTKFFFMFGYSIRIEQLTRFMLDTHVKPYTSHLSTFCFGLLIGSFVSRKTKLTLRKEFIVLLWIVAAVLLGLAVFGLHGYIREEFPNENILFVHKIFSPYAWTVGIAWVCVACITGNGGVVNWFLSMKVFVILDRLNIWIYLIHPIITLYIYAQLRSTHYISEMNTWMFFVFVMFLTVIVSTIVYIFLQTPLDFLINKIFDQNCLKKPSSVKVYNLESVSTKNPL